MREDPRQSQAARKSGRHTLGIEWHLCAVANGGMPLSANTHGGSMIAHLLESLTQLPLLARFAFALTVILVAPVLCRRLGLPPIVGFLAAGVVFGPYGLHVGPRDNGVPHYSSTILNPKDRKHRPLGSPPSRSTAMTLSQHGTHYGR
jgi:hypothetical protein